MIGYHSSKLSDLFEKHKEAVHRLESTLASYLSGVSNIYVYLYGWFN